MCRHLAWLGAERSLASLMCDPSMSLVRQAHSPQRQTHGKFNADGFGVGWYAADVRAEPARYRRSVAIWTDPSLVSFAPVVRSTAFLAAVRSASPGMPVEESATAPFLSGRWLLSHNGQVRTDVVRARLDADAVPESTCDSALLASYVFGLLAAGESVPRVLAEVVPALAAADHDARLNLLLTDGAQIAATAWGASLCYLSGSGLAAGGTLVASEPLDDGLGWIDVPERSLLVATPDGVRVSAIDIPLDRLPL